MLNSQESNKIIDKYTKRAFWMNNPLSNEFKLFFLEMVTEIRKASGREFNFDITLEDIKRTLQILNEKYPLTRNVSFNTILKTLNTMQSVSQLGDLFSVASAVSISFMPLGVLFTGPVLYIFLKFLAPQRLKCGLIMGIGGLIALELYNTNPGFYNKPVLTAKKNTFSVPPAVFGCLALITGALLFFLRMELLYRILIGIFTGINITLFILWICIDLSRSGKIKKQKEEYDSQVFHFQISTSHDFPFQFRLDNEEARFLFSIQYYLSEKNINDTQDSIIKGNKRIWLDKWKSDIENTIGRSIVTDWKVLEEACRNSLDYLSKTKTSLIFIECVLYRPFYEMNIMPGLKFPGKERRLKENLLTDLGKILGQDYPVKKILSYYREALNSISAVNMLKKIIESFFTSGARISILQESTGMVKSSTMIYPDESKSDRNAEAFRDISFIICGGIIINENLNKHFLQAASYDSGFALKELARLESALKTIFENQPVPYEISDNIITMYINVRDNMIKMFNQSERGLDELKKSVHYFETAIKRIESLFKASHKSHSSKIKNGKVSLSGQTTGTPG